MTRRSSSSAFERIQGPGAELFGESAAGVDGLVASYRDLARRFEGSPDLQILNFELALLAIRNPRVHDHLESGMRESIAAVAERLPEASGSTDADRMAAAALIVGLGNGVALVRMFAPDLVPLESVDGALRRLAATS